MIFYRQADWIIPASLGLLLGACGPDTTPDAFTLEDQDDVAFSTVVTSNEVVITGIEEPVPIEIVDGSYSIDGGPYTAAAGTIERGQAVRVQLTSGDDYDETRSATLTVGDVSDRFDVTTVKDMELPAASIAFPHLDETWVLRPEVVVRGVASDNVQVASVAVNGVEATSSDGFATWQARLELVPGQANKIDVTVTDLQGNVVDPADSITVNAHAHPDAGGCGVFSYDMANNRMFSGHPLAETSLTDGSFVPLLSTAGYDYYSAYPLYDDVEGRLYIINDGVLAEVDLTNRETVTTISPEGRDGISMGGVSRAVLDKTSGTVYAYSDMLAAVVSISIASGNRSIVTSNTIGDGPALGFLTFLALGGSRLFAATGDFEPVVLEIDLTSGNRTVISGNGVGSGDDFLYIQGLVADSASSVIYVADLSGDLFAVGPSNGARTIASPAAEGLRNGAVFEQHLGMQFVEGNDMVFVSDCQHRQLLAIDPNEGARSILTSPFRGDGPPLIDGMAMALRQGGGTLLTLNRRGGIRESTGSVNNLISVDTTTGNRAIVSNAAVGSGDAVMYAFDLIEDSAHGRYLITDSEANAIIAIDPGTGDRAIISDNVSHGAGVQFRTPHGIAIDAAGNRAVVVDPGLDALIGVDLETGDRTIITQVGGAGSGDDFDVPVDIELDMANDRAFVTDQSLNAVFSVDLTSGARTILSGDTAGSGEPLPGPTRIAFDPNNQRIVVTNLQGSIAHIDPTTGNRDFRTSTGPGFSCQPEAIAVEPGSGLLYVTCQSPDSVHVYDYEANASVIVSQ